MHLLLGNADCRVGQNLCWLAAETTKPTNSTFFLSIQQSSDTIGAALDVGGCCKFL